MGKETRSGGRTPPTSEFSGLRIATIEGFGQPWKVCVRAALTWDRLNDGKETDLILMRDHVVGVQIEYEHPDGGTRLRLTRALTQNYDVRWAVSGHDQLGVLLESVDVNQMEALARSRRAGSTGRAGSRRTADLWDGGLFDNCKVAPEYKDMYADVVKICHERIWEENLETLWNGDESRMPGTASLAAKLFRPATLVVHVSDSIYSDCVGGAILRYFNVPCTCGGRSLESLVLYIDSCAAARGCRAGTALWMHIARLPAAVVVLHSIPLEDTMSFWISRGLRQVDVDSSRHQRWFSDEIMAKSGGQMDMNLADLRIALPHSELPLFVFVPKNVDRAVDLITNAQGKDADLDADPDEWSWLPSAASSRRQWDRSASV